MRRLVIAAALVALGLAGWRGSQSPLFNAGVSSPELVPSLAADYLAVDTLFGGMTNPASMDAALRQLTPPPPPSLAGNGLWRPAATITRAEDGIQLALQAEEAVAGLGATAELLPVRLELSQSYQDVEQAWRLERRIEQAFDQNGAVSPGTLIQSRNLDQLAAHSLQQMRQAQSLHDQAMTAVHALLLASGAPAEQTTADADLAGQTLTWPLVAGHYSAPAVRLGP
jgi:hypothetical protein